MSCGVFRICLSICTESLAGFWLGFCRICGGCYVDLLACLGMTAWVNLSPCTRTSSDWWPVDSWWAFRAPHSTPRCLWFLPKVPQITRLYPSRIKIWCVKLRLNAYWKNQVLWLGWKFLATSRVLCIWMFPQNSQNTLGWTGLGALLILWRRAVIGRDAKTLSEIPYSANSVAGAIRHDLGT